MIERTLVMIKPDGVQRGLIGRILSRFEDAGLKIVGLKMIWADKDFALKHYTEDITKRRGEKVRNQLTEFLQIGPVVSMCLEGVQAIDNVRKIIGTTEPKAAPPGTIRGDFAHVSFKYADSKNKVVKNLIHASANENDAKYEVPLWFSDQEIHSYKSVHDAHILE